jgi:hypothetical protein
VTERLTTLLHDEATTLDIPAVPADRILAQGRGLQRRRRATVAVTGAVAAVLVAAVALTAVTAGRGDDRKIEPASPEDTAAYQELGAWAAADEVHIGNHVVTVPGVADLRYTSLGVIAFSPASQRDEASDPVPARTTLVTPDGQAHPLDHAGLDELTALPPATDPSTPYIAYPRETDDPSRSELVVLDLRSDDETVAGKEFATAAFAPGLGIHLSGDLVTYLQGRTTAQTTVRINWHTDERVPFDYQGFVSQDGFGSSAYLSYDTSSSTWQVWPSTGSTRLLRVPLGSSDDYGNAASLSPDGRYLAVSTGENGIRVYSVETGDSVELGGDRDIGDYGWTPDGHLVGKQYPNQESEVERCDPATGACIGTGEVLAPRLTLVNGAQGSAV